MNLFIDCEWNGYRGSLLSIALVPQDRRKENFYAEIELPRDEPIDTWVAQHVVPHFLGNPISYKCAQDSLERYLSQFQSIRIMADWPEDIERFCRMLITGPGKRLMYEMPLHFCVTRFKGVDSLVPHNALYDAAANRASYMKGRGSSRSAVEPKP